jgi:hypothetical protein
MIKKWLDVMKSTYRRSSAPTESAPSLCEPPNSAKSTGPTRLVSTKPTEATLRRKSRPPGIPTARESQRRKRAGKAAKAPAPNSSPASESMSLDLSGFTPEARAGLERAVWRYVASLKKNVRKQAQNHEVVLAHHVKKAEKTLKEPRRPPVINNAALALGGGLLEFGASNFLNLVQPLPNRNTLLAFALSMLFGLSLCLILGRR